MSKPKVYKTRILQTVSVSALLLLSFIGGISFYNTFAPLPDSETQQIALQATVWRLEKQFKLTKYYISLEVRRKSSMIDCGCWAITDMDKLQVVMMDMRDYPAAMPWADRVTFQKGILQHELMHIVMTDWGVPRDRQDGLIEGVRPFLVQP